MTKETGEVLKPTLNFRWDTTRADPNTNFRSVLQQAWINGKGDYDWKDIPVYEKPKSKKE